MYYLDANIFIYSGNYKSPYFKACTKILDLAVDDEIDIATSTETIQEIVHFMKRVETTEEAFALVKIVLKITHFVVPVDQKVIETYLDLILKYRNLSKVQSRDFIHIATCIETKIDTLITYDKKLKLIKEIKTASPEEIVGLN